MVLLQPVQIEEGFINRIGFRMRHSRPQNVVHPVGHGRIEIHVRRKQLHPIVLHNILLLEDGVSTTQPQCLGFRGQGNNAAIVAGKHTDGLSVQSGMEDLFHGTEEAVAID